MPFFRLSLNKLIKYTVYLASPHAVAMGLQETYWFMSLANYNLNHDAESNNLHIKHGAIHAVCQLIFMVYP